MIKLASQRWTFLHFRNWTSPTEKTRKIGTRMTSTSCAAWRFRLFPCWSRFMWLKRSPRFSSSTVRRTTSDFTSSRGCSSGPLSWSSTPSCGSRSDFTSSHHPKRLPTRCSRLFSAAFRCVSCRQPLLMVPHLINLLQSSTSTVSCASTRCSCWCARRKNISD